MSNVTLITLLIIGGMVIIGAIMYFVVRSSQKASQRYITLYDLVDGRMTELIALNKQSSERGGRLAERADQLLREQREKEQSDEHRRIQTTEQANRIITEQETPDQQQRRNP